MFPGIGAGASFSSQPPAWFFDNYVVPHAKKLKDGRVFGVNCNECLSYAVRNRAEWKVRGEGKSRKW